MLGRFDLVEARNGITTEGTESTEGFKFWLGELTVCEILRVALASEHDVWFLESD
jgi:hypothetical protein